MMSGYDFSQEFANECLEIADKENERLITELAAAKAEIERLKDDWKLALREIDIKKYKLAARDLVIKQMREALIAFCDGDVPDDDAPEGYVRKAKNALALQPTTEALDAYVKQERERFLDLIDECPGLSMEQDNWLSSRVRKP
jgi:hypothetical protein